MNNPKIRVVILALISVLLWGAQGNTLEKRTHEEINWDIARIAGGEFSLNRYLIDNLGFKTGSEELLSGYSDKYKQERAQRIWQWFGEGGWNEDEPDGLVRMVLNGGRSNNHFHNPLQEDWERAGLNAYAGPFWYTGQSSTLWAQNLEQDFGGNWSWHEARKYYYEGLTATSRAKRERSFANMFRALGHLAHLVQDSSVPAHVRNDIHIVYHYEKWLENIQRSNDPEIRKKFVEFMKDPISFDSSLLESSFNEWTDIPIVKAIDADKYIGSNPSVTASATAERRALVGLAEYTNANFFSEDTIVSSAFPYPKLNRAVLGKRYIPDPRDANEIVAREYYEKTNDGDTGYRLAAVSFLEGFKEEYTPEYGEAAVHSLDDAVYEDYARKLLPRAIGYSSGLLKYFFRGSLQVTAIPIFYRGTLQIMRLKIKNLTPNEEMRNGEFALTFRYTPPGGNMDGSNDIFKPAWGSDGSAFVPCPSLEPGKEIAIDFKIYPALPEKDYVDLRFDLAFQGTLGIESGAVIGKSFKPGQVIFEEEWDRPLPGNYLWAHTGVNLESFNPDNGSSTNLISNDILAKDNIRKAGSPLGRVNESFLGHGSFPGPFPLAITPNTYLIYRIDEMSMTPLNPPDLIIGHQFLLLSFTDLLTLMISQPGQMEGWNTTTAYYTFTPGEIVLDNIYESFQRAGIAIPDAFRINFLSLAQRWYELGAAAGADHVQRMKVDFIQLVEASVE